MANNFDIVSGNFRGYFYTNQKTALASGEKIPEGKIHEIHLYQGELNDVVKESEYKPETLRNRESLILHNVTNVQFHLNSATESKKQIYDFEQLLLNNPVVENSWELNGKTYGIVSGNLLGKVKELSSIVGPINPPPNPDPPINPNPKPNPINIGGNGDDNNNGGNNNGGNGENKKGCLATPLALLSGCLANIWRLLLILLLLGLLFWLFKNCKGCSREVKKDCCEERDSLEIENKRLNEKFDSLSLLIIDNKKQRQKDSIQNQISSLASKIFFKKTKTEIRDYSIDEIEKIVSILNKYPEAKIEVQGYYDIRKSNQSSSNVNGDLDQKRADIIRDFLIEKGINSDRIIAIGKGRSTLDESESITGYDDEGNPYNRNMRVDIIVTNF
jgi:outer membrane protein OmpA-like peptidoglycan-associated protein